MLTIALSILVAGTPFLLWFMTHRYGKESTQRGKAIIAQNSQENEANRDLLQTVAAAIIRIEPKVNVMFAEHPQILHRLADIERWSAAERLRMMV